MAAKRVRSGVSKRTEFWNVRADRSNPTKGTKIIVKAAVRNSLGQFHGATNFTVGQTVSSARIEG